MPALPPELWLAIFWLATRPDHAHHLQSFYRPFQKCSFDLDGLAATLSTRRTLVQVCRLWRTLARPLLFEDLRPNPATSRAILGGPPDDNPGRWVRRIELPYTQTSTDTPDRPGAALRILACCPSLHTLVRPYTRCDPSLPFDRPAGPVPLLSALTRLDWWHRDNAALTGGINSLVDVLSCAPALRYLSLAGGSKEVLGPALPVHLPALTTLRLRDVPPLSIADICRWSLPALVHVVVDRPPRRSDVLIHLWHTFANQLHTVEFGPDARFITSDPITELVDTTTSSPRRGAIRVLNYHACFTCPPVCRVRLDQYTSFESVGLHSASSQDFPGPWPYLVGHFQWLAGPNFSSLRHVVLYGDWTEIMRDPRFGDFERRLAEMGRDVQLASDVV